MNVLEVAKEAKRLINIADNARDFNDDVMVCIHYSYDSVRFSAWEFGIDTELAPIFNERLERLDSSDYQGDIEKVRAALCKYLEQEVVA